jgi:hypothetical protein
MVRGRHQDAPFAGPLQAARVLPKSYVTAPFGAAEH